MPDGTISGSARTILDGVRNLVGLGIPLEQAVKAASYNPARTLGLAASIGSIAVSKEADFVIMDKSSGGTGDLSRGMLRIPIL